MSDLIDKGLKKIGVTISKPTLALICLIFGIIVLIFPATLVYIVGIFLIIEGVLLLTDYLEVKKQQEPPPPAPQANKT